MALFSWSTPAQAQPPLIFMKRLELKFNKADFVVSGLNLAAQLFLQAKKLPQSELARQAQFQM